MNQRADEIRTLLDDAAYGDVLDALEDLSKAWAAWPRVEALFGLEDWDELPEALEEAMETPGPVGRAEVMRAYVTLYTGELDEAVGLFDAALAAVPEEPDALRGKAVAVRFLGEDADAAADCLKRALAALPQVDADHATPRTMHKRAQCLRDLGILAIEDDDLANAELHWLAASRARPEDGEYLLDLARLYSHLERRDDAVRMAHAAVEATPLLVEAYALASHCLAMDQRFEEAVDAAQQGIDADPEEPFSYANLANTLLLAGKFEESLAAANIAIRLDPTLPDPYQVRAAALDTLGRVDEFPSEDAGFLQQEPALPLFLFGELFATGLSLDDVLAQVAQMSPDDLKRAAEDALQSGLLPEAMRPMVESMMGQLPQLMQQLPALMGGGAPLTEVADQPIQPVITGDDLRSQLRIIDGGKDSDG